MLAHPSQITVFLMLSASPLALSVGANLISCSRIQCIFISAPRERLCASPLATFSRPFHVWSLSSAAIITQRWDYTCAEKGEERKLSSHRRVSRLLPLWSGTFVFFYSFPHLSNFVKWPWLWGMTRFSKIKMKIFQRSHSFSVLQEDMCDASTIAASQRRDRREYLIFKLFFINNIIFYYVSSFLKY